MGNVVRIPNTSAELVRFPVFAEQAGAQLNPTAVAPMFAFVDQGLDPVGVDDPLTYALTGSWDTVVRGSNTTYFAQFLSPTSLTSGKRYWIWVKMVQGGQDIRRRVGVLDSI